MTQGACQVYRHFDATGGLLYVGVSLSSVNRLSQHRKSPWFNRITTQKVEHFPTRADALAAETEAIRTENPQFNVHHKRVAEPEPTPTPYESSREELLQRVRVRPVYTITELADLLKVGISAVKRLIDKGELGHFVIEFRGRDVQRVTGWQLIDYLESAARVPA